MSRGAFESNESQALLGHFHSSILKLETRNVQRSEILERQCAFMQVSILRSPVDVYYLQERCTATLHCMVVARETVAQEIPQRQKALESCTQPYSIRSVCPDSRNLILRTRKNSASWAGTPQAKFG